MWFDNLLTFIELGFRHILPLGLDHVLFIAAMYLAARSWRALLLQVTAFTLAHTVSLGLATTGVVTPPAGVVEPLIAASIVVVALMAVIRRAQTHWKTSIVLLFGLLHGLGFAGVIQGYLEGAEFVTGLIGFNLGVELGQLVVIGVVGAVCVAGRGLLARIGLPEGYRPFILVPASSLIALVGLVMLLGRLPYTSAFVPQI